MTTLAAKKRREKTNTNRKRGTIVFDPPGGVYQPIFGKTTIYLSGQGQPGNYPQNSAIANYNPSTGGTIAGYNPVIPGNVVSYNPSTPGNYAGTNNPTGGNIAYYNPTVRGNVRGYNPVSPGTLAYNAPVPGQIVYTVTRSNIDSFYSANYYISGYFVVAPYTSYNGANQWFHTINVARPAGFFVPGNSYYNPSTGGNAIYNAPTGGNAVYNAIVPGFAYYNPSTPGNANYNPSSGGTANYNPVIPGNANYNNYVAGNPGTPFEILGVRFPGGDVASAAPVIPRALVYAPYKGEGQGYPIPVPTGAKVIVEEE